jgi:hypothetical protein
MDLSEYDQIIKSLAALAAHQQTLNDSQILTNRRLEEHAQDIKAILQQQAAVNAQQAVVNTQNTTLIMRIVRTLDRIDEKLDRIFPERS